MTCTSGHRTPIKTSHLCIFVRQSELIVTKYILGFWESDSLVSRPGKTYCEIDSDRNSTPNLLSGGKFNAVKWLNCWLFLRFYNGKYVLSLSTGGP